MRDERNQAERIYMKGENKETKEGKVEGKRKKVN
jgi:hypothetical protein